MHIRGFFFWSRSAPAQPLPDRVERGRRSPFQRQLTTRPPGRSAFSAFERTGRAYDLPPMTTTPLPMPAVLTPTDRRPRPASAGLVRPALALAHRELVRFLRQRSRVIGSLVTPLVFWLFIGGGMQHSFAAPGQTAGGGGYIQYFFPGTVLMILLFTAIFSTISIIEDRHEGFLQSVLVAPVPRSAIVLGKVLGGATLGFGQALLFLLLAPTVGIRLTVTGFLGATAVMAVLAFGLTALGFCFAWRSTSTQGFHVVMNLFFMPLWFLSGALFPADGATGPIRWVMKCNPLTYGLDGLRRCLYHADPAVAGREPPFWVCMAISVAFAGALFALAGAVARRSGEA
jgi:ABC-2 type transport system permease protein